MFYGIIMEIMLPTVSILSLLFYPVSALFCGLLFADRSAAQLQYARSAGKRAKNASPLLRTVLCAMVNTIVYETVNLVYMYLSGADLSSALILRGFTDVFFTTLLTVIIMVPVRKLLGFRKAEQTTAPELRFDHRPARD